MGFLLNTVRVHAQAPTELLWKETLWIVHVTARQGESIVTNLVQDTEALLWLRHKGLPWSDSGVSWQDLDLVRPVGAGECEIRLNVPRLCWAGGFICSDRHLTVCDDERQLRVGARHRLFSWQCELWRPEGARACISRPLTPINPSLKGCSAETPDATLCGLPGFHHWLKHDGDNGPSAS